jgi:radical SAM superfamily enzyme YgiQ (UPF0313 family)
MTDTRRTLLLINPAVKTGTGFTVNFETRYQPLSLGIIAALTPPHWKVKILDENFRNFKYYPADLVGLTAFTSTVSRAYELAQVYREKGIPTVIGGIHTSMCPEEARRYVDTVVIGEAENIWPTVIEDFENGRLRREYRGQLTPLIHQPRARRDLFFPGYFFASIETSRGCPMNCSFCSVTAFNGSHYRYRPIEEVIDEWKVIPQNNIAILDDNIVGYTPGAQQRAIELFKAIEATGLRKQWIGQASLNVADNEDVLRHAARSGCKMLFLGIETEQEDQLRSVNKKINLKMGIHSYDRVFRKIHKYGMAAIAGFIFGWPSETRETIDKRVEFIRNCQADSIQVALLTPLPGTAIYCQLEKEGRIVLNHYPDDWKYYGYEQLVFKPDHMDRIELQDYFYKRIARAYKPTLLKRRFYRSWLQTRKLSTAYMSYMSYHFYRNVTFGSSKPGNIKWVERLLGLGKSDRNRPFYG